MPNRQVFTESRPPNIRARVERYRSGEHIPEMLIRGKVKESRPAGSGNEEGLV